MNENPYASPQPTDCQEPLLARTRWGVVLMFLNLCMHIGLFSAGVHAACLMVAWRVSWGNVIVANLGIYGATVIFLEVRTMARFTRSQELLRCWLCCIGNGIVWAFLATFVEAPPSFRSFELRYPPGPFKVLAIPAMMLYGIGLMWLRSRQLRQATTRR